MIALVWATETAKGQTEAHMYMCACVVWRALFTLQKEERKLGIL